MGAEQSIEDQDETSKVGYHVLYVREGSPADRAGFEPYFDYIVTAGGQRLDSNDPGIFTKILQDCEHRELQVTLFNSKRQSFRQTTITPTRKWNGEGLLGCSIRFCSYAHAAENVWHVMSVYPNSPAERAGLRPDHDYIIGTPEAPIKDKNDLFDLVGKFNKSSLRLFVYNWQTDGCREIQITPDTEWGGEGSLGCDIGFGYLHRIPNVPYGEANGDVKPVKQQVETGDADTEEVVLSSEPNGTHHNHDGHDHGPHEHAHDRHNEEGFTDTPLSPAAAK